MQVGMTVWCNAHQVADDVFLKQDHTSLGVVLPCISSAWCDWACIVGSKLGE